MLRVAMVGLGVQGTRLVESVHGKSKDVAVVLGATVDSAEAARARQAYGFAVSGRFEDVLSSDVDAVVLATPPVLHHQQTMAAARAGKHVYCEKPFTFDVAQALEAMATCRASRVKLAVAYTHRLHPPMLELARLVREGALGTILHAEANYSHDFAGPLDRKSWRALPEASPGRARFFAANSVHALDALISLLGPVASVYAQGVHRAGPAEHLDAVVAQLKFTAGMMATLTGVDGTPFIWRVQVYGTKGWAEVRNFRRLTVQAGTKTTVTEYPLTSVLRTGLEAFAAEVAGRADYPVSATEVIDGVAAFEGVVESLASGRPAAIPAPGDRVRIVQ